MTYTFALGIWKEHRELLRDAELDIFTIFQKYDFEPSGEGGVEMMYHDNQGI